MKDRRGFLKLLGIGAGAAVAMVAARIASTPTTPPRTIQDIERPVKPYIGPDSIPGGDYIKERPKVVPDIIKTPDLTDEQYKWIVDGEQVLTFDPAPAPFQLDPIDWDTVEWNSAPLTPGSLILTPPNVTYVDAQGLRTTSGTTVHNMAGNTTDAKS